MISNYVAYICFVLDKNLTTVKTTTLSTGVRNVQLPTHSPTDSTVGTVDDKREL